MYVADVPYFRRSQIPGRADKQDRRSDANARRDGTNATISEQAAISDTLPARTGGRGGRQTDQRTTIRMGRVT